MVLKNARHERFAQELAKGLTATEAYELAGYKGDRTAASRLSTNVNVRNRVQELMEKVTAKVIEKTAVDKEWVLSRLVENANRAMQAVAVNGPEGPTGEYKYEGGVANKALELIGKELGMFVDRSENLNMNYEVGPEPLSEDEWAEKHATEH